jgi:hypothetical protein
MPYGPQLPDKPGRINIKDGMMVPDPAGVGWQAKKRAMKKQGINPPKDPPPSFRMTEEEQARAAAEALESHRKGEGPLRMRPAVPLGKEPPTPTTRAGRPGMTQSEIAPPMDEGPQPGFRNAGTTYLKQNIIPYYGGPGAADREIEASLQARKNRPAHIDMSGFGDFTKEDYIRPQPHDWEDPLNHFTERNPKALAYFQPEGKYGSIHFNQEKFPDWQNSKGYHDTLTHERTHGAMHDDPDSPSLMASPRGNTNSPYVTSKPEISARAAEIRRMFTHYTGTPVRTHEDALEAMHWYLKNHQKMLDDNHKPTAGPETVNEYLTLPGVEREKVLQRMLEVAGMDRIRGSLLG